MPSSSNDEVFLDALGTERIPDPTTAGDFCRRFDETDIRSLMGAADEARLNVWAWQPKEFCDRATIDMDGTLVITTGKCKEGMDISYQGTWGYHPLVISLAETGEVLRLIYRVLSYTRTCRCSSGLPDKSNTSEK